ncbi:ferritin family protein [bacterium]|nr:ferritin family protein [bacterium]
MSNGGGIFQVSEIVQMAVDEEHNGYYFYKTLADCADHAGLREMAVTLAEQEQGHETAFIALRDELGSQAPNESYPGEYADYMAVLVNGKTFPDEEGAIRLAQESGGDAGAVDLAILFEKNTLLFLGEMRKLVAERHQGKVDILIDEERQHLVDLARIRPELG